MSRFDRATSPAALLISVLALVVATGAGSAYAAAKVGSGQIKNGAVTSAKIKNGAVTTAKLAPSAVDGGRIKDGTVTAADLAPSTLASLKASSTSWAYITQSGTVGRGTPGVTSEAQLNGGFWQYRVTFPKDISGCGYQVSSGDGAAIGSNEYVIPSLVAVARSTQGPRVLAVNLYQWDTGTSIQDTFFVAVTC